MGGARHWPSSKKWDPGPPVGSVSHTLPPCVRPRHLCQGWGGWESLPRGCQPGTSRRPQLPLRPPKRLAPSLAGLHPHGDPRRSRLRVHVHRGDGLDRSVLLHTRRPAGGRHRRAAGVRAAAGVHGEGAARGGPLGRSRGRTLPGKPGRPSRQHRGGEAATGGSGRGG